MTELTLTYTQTGVLLTTLKTRENELVNWIQYLEDSVLETDRDITLDLDTAYDQLDAIRGIIRQCEG